MKLALTIFCGIAFCFLLILFPVCKQEEENAAKTEEEETEGEEEDEEEITRDEWLEEKKNDVRVSRALKNVKGIDYSNVTKDDVLNAIICGDLETLKKIKKAGFSQWNDPELVLRAATSPFPEIMQFLAMNDADLSAKDKSGRTALMVAAIHGNINTAKYVANQTGSTAGVNLKRFSYLKKMTIIRSIQDARQCMSSKIREYYLMDREIDKPEVRAEIMVSLAKQINFKRDMETPPNMKEVRQKAYAEADAATRWGKRQFKLENEAKKKYPLYPLLSEVCVRFKIMGRSLTVKGTLEESTSRYIVVSQQRIHYMDMEYEEACKYSKQMNKQARETYIQRLQEQQKILRERTFSDAWRKTEQTAKAHGYFYDVQLNQFIHAQKILDEQIAKVQDDVKW